MKSERQILMALMGAVALSRSMAAPSGKEDPGPPPVANEADPAQRADKRYEEMLGRMQSAVEEIAQLYGNPVFLQVFTNDAERASVLKQRLRNAGSGDSIGHQIKDLGTKRDDLLNDIALKEREVARLSARLARQRAALDALANAVEQARKAVEDTTK